MSYYEESEQSKIIKARKKLGVALWDDQNTERYNPSCLTCVDHQKLKLEGTDWVCRQCGNRTPTVETKHEKRLTAKFGSGPSGPVIISQQEKKKKSNIDSVNPNLDEETKAELRAMGYRI